jgi:hypothetical protein
MKKKTNIPLRLPKETVALLEKLALLAETDVATVVRVMMAFEIERPIRAGITPRRLKAKA